MDQVPASANRIDLCFDSSKALLDALYTNYSANAKIVISKIRQDKMLSQFDRFNKRLKISWGMKIEFTDNLPITRYLSLEQKREHAIS